MIVAPIFVFAYIVMSRVELRGEVGAKRSEEVGGYVTTRAAIGR
jgi:hypothetical protein